jgi:hypothetical protein
MTTSDDLTIVSPPAAEPRPVETIHPLDCFHAKWRMDHTRVTEARDAALAALTATFTDEQRRLYGQFEDASGDAWYSEQDRFVEGLVGHFPGLAGALRAVAYHVTDGQRIGCCPKVTSHLGPSALSEQPASSWGPDPRGRTIRLVAANDEREDDDMDGRGIADCCWGPAGLPADL